MFALERLIRRWFCCKSDGHIDAKERAAIATPTARTGVEEQGRVVYRESY